MPVFLTSTPRYSHAVKYEFDPSVAYTREAIVINDTAQTLVQGTVLGKVTATGKYKVCLSGASDGSQVPAGIYVGDALGVAGDYTIAASTDSPAMAIVRGPVILSDTGLTYGTGNNLATTKAAFALLNPPILFATGV